MNKLSKFYNTSLNRVPNSGGSVRLTIGTNGATANEAFQVASTPCKKVWISASKKDMRVTIGTNCTAITGMALPIRDSSSYSGEILVLEIDDINALYFYGAVDDETVDILYRE